MKNLLSKCREAARAAADQRAKPAEPPSLFAAEDIKEIERAESLRAERRAVIERGKKGRKHA